MSILAVPPDFRWRTSPFSAVFARDSLKWPAINIVVAAGFFLGWLVTRSLVALHGGTIAVESREGEGTTFVVTLPAERVTVQSLLADAAE